MRAASVIGKRIKAVKQIRFSDHGIMKTDVKWIELENGVRLIPITVEVEEGEYAHEFAVNKTGMNQ